ncbi:phosphopantetheine-binding protein [Nonomuraea sp. NPDC059023]|uniref:phosphopantetheine-binding protein n=1 Tax=unclassified Nonomuraea TaxID=2593643 RepID=UPI00367388BF
MTVIMNSVTLREIWQDILGVEVGETTDFFDASGDSLSAMRIYARVTDAFGVVLPLSTIFDSPRFDEFALAVEAHAQSQRGDGEQRR